MQEKGGIIKVIDIDRQSDKPMPSEKKSVIGGPLAVLIHSNISKAWFRVDRASLSIRLIKK